MGRIDQRLVGKRHEPVVQRIVEPCAEILGSPAKRRPQVRAADVSDKKSVSGENGMWFAASFWRSKTRIEMDSIVWPGVSRTSRRIPGKSSVSPSFIATNAYSAWARRAEMDRRAATVAQFQMPGDEIGVKMGEEYVPDLKAKFRRHRPGIAGYRVEDRR